VKVLEVFSSNKDTPLIKVCNVLTQLKNVFALFNIESQLGDFIIDGYLDQNQVSMIKSAYRKLLEALRPNLVSLVDAWGFPDFILNSSLGRYKGDVYEHMYEWASKNGLNEYEVLPPYHDYVKPLIHSTKSKL